MRNASRISRSKEAPTAGLTALPRAGSTNTNSERSGGASKERKAYLPGIVVWFQIGRQYGAPAAVGDKFRRFHHGVQLKPIADAATQEQIQSRFGRTKSFGRGRHF